MTDQGGATTELSDVRFGFISGHSAMRERCLLYPKADIPNMGWQVG
jgi:hypothetical protein